MERRRPRLPLFNSGQPDLADQATEMFSAKDISSRGSLMTAYRSENERLKRQLAAERRHSAILFAIIMIATVIRLVW